jgi:hypothetical protein
MLYDGLLHGLGQKIQWGAGRDTPSGPIDQLKAQLHCVKEGLIAGIRNIKGQFFQEWFCQFAQVPEAVSDNV